MKHCQHEYTLLFQFKLNVSRLKKKKVFSFLLHLLLQLLGDDGLLTFTEGCVQCRNPFS